MKVLLSAYVASPYRGSEEGNAWNWAWSLSCHHQVYLLTSSIWREDIEAYLSEHQNENIKILWTDVPKSLFPLDRRKAFWRRQVHYVVWLNYSFHRARYFHARHKFDIAHHVVFNVFAPAPKLHRLPIPFVWGPVGGGMTAPRSFLPCFGAYRWREALRTLRVNLSQLLPSVRQAAQKSDLIFVANPETGRLLENAGAKNPIYQLDCGCTQNFIVSHIPDKRSREQLTLLWAGRLVPRKALPLALAALAKVPHLRVRLVVVGAGIQAAQWRQQTTDLRLDDRVIFRGEVSWQRMVDEYRAADAFLFTSLRDTSGSVVLEAMANGLPILGLHHQGVGAFVPAAAGIMVPVTRPAETISALARAIEQLVCDPELRAKMGRVGWSFARTQTWERRALVMTSYYERLQRQRLIR